MPITNIDIIVKTIKWFNTTYTGLKVICTYKPAKVFSPKYVNINGTAEYLKCKGERKLDGLCTSV